MTVIRHIRLADVAKPTKSTLVDLTISGDHIASISPATEDPVSDGQIDGGGLWAVAGLVNAHAHVDKSWWGQEWVSFGGEWSLDGRIQWERQQRGPLGIPGVEPTVNVLREFARTGTTAVRSHIDVDTGIGLAGLEAAHEAFAIAAGMRYELIAFPQDGVLRRPGVAELLTEAAKKGLVQHIGGLDPAGIDRDPVGQLDIIFGIAAEYDLGIDIHLHDPGSLGGFQFDLICDRTEKLGRQGKVTVAHGMALGELSPARQAELVDRMAELDVTLTTVVPVGSAKLPWHLMQGRVGLGFGTDGIRDLWSPYGDGDLMPIVSRFARWQGARFDEELMTVLDEATWRSLRFVSVESNGIEEGSPADFMLVDAANPMDAMVRAPKPQWVFASGKQLVANGEPTF